LHEDLVAKSWGINLRDWYELDEEIRAEQIAVYEVENQMQAYDQQEADRKAKAKAK
jgi:DNA-directed RNA polymerase delta subunit